MRTGTEFQAIKSLEKHNDLHNKGQEKTSLPGGLEPPTFRLTAERASRLRHGSLPQGKNIRFLYWCTTY